MPMFTELVEQALSGAVSLVRKSSTMHWAVGLVLEVACVYLVLRVVWRGVWAVWEWGDSYTHYLKLAPYSDAVRAPIPGSLAPLPPTGPGARSGTRSMSRSVSAAAASRARPIHCFDKATGETLGHVPAMDQETVTGLVLEAKEAQVAWRNSSFDQRRAALRALLDAVVANQAEICRHSAVDSGKTMMEAVFGEILTVAEKLRWTIANGEDALKSEARSPGFMMHKGAHVEYRPLGVIGIICPYNYPFHHILSPLATALFAGNGAVIKVSEWTTWSLHAFYADLVLDALASAGVPRGLVQFVTGWGDAGAALVTSPYVDKIFFTGSPATGRKVMLAAAETLKPVILELGGKDPLIICEDADVDLAFNYAMRGVYMSGGQNCIGAERILVHESHYDMFVERVAAEVPKLRIGVPLSGDTGAWDMGPLTFPKQIGIVQELVDDAVAKGATLVAGGHKLDVPGADGIFYAPTVLANVDHSMRIVHEEVFGPVMLLMRFSTDVQAVQMANDVKYGLSCSVFSKSTARANRMAGAIATGMAVVNDYGITYTMQGLPFGGVKVSGFGRFNGPEGLREASATVAVVTERWSIPTSLPRPFTYPVQNHAFDLVEAAIRMGYSSGIWNKIQGGLDFVRVSWNGEHPKTE